MKRSPRHLEPRSAALTLELRHGPTLSLTRLLPAGDVPVEHMTAWHKDPVELGASMRTNSSIMPRRRPSATY